MLPEALLLHHIGQVVPEIASAAAHHIKLLGYSQATPILHDPIQTALVQFLLLPPSAVYLELIAPDGPESKLTRAATQRPGLHHLCYTAGPLEPTIAHLTANGMLLVSPPQPAQAFNKRRICWLLGAASSLIELVERTHPTDPCTPR